VNGLLRGLRERRLSLVERSRAQRTGLAARFVPLARKLGTVDRIVARLRAHPVLSGLAAAGVVALFPRAMLRLALVYAAGAWR
jgi:hypothetical protein